MRTFLALMLAACGGPVEPECAVDGDCEGEACVDGVCVPRPDAGRRDAGCASGCECIIASDCPAVAACAENVCEANVCRVIEHDEECAPIGVCDATMGCVAPSVDGGMDGGMDAGRDAGMDAGPGPPVGRACADATECSEVGARPMCLVRESNSNTDFEGGYCTTRCDFGGCPMGICWQPGGLLSSYCLRSCASDAECRTAEGYVCGVPRVGMLQTSGMVCIPSSLAR